ncbi:hypothetical protein QTL95_21675 [Rhizobium sp. S152]|uniref:hypothetical protein n=1 Tax=Rhizobium sp. S152 TaxID=3055038 RepID=UPI0025A9DFF5|nr:hypothetical protein [Rhizobium sp. S152]MDM9628511.1 hypothetical protein [Rhizobium sp. S152]
MLAGFDYLGIKRKLGAIASPMAAVRYIGTSVVRKFAALPRSILDMELLDGLVVLILVPSLEAIVVISVINVRRDFSVEIPELGLTLVDVRRGVAVESGVFGIAIPIYKREVVTTLDDHQASPRSLSILVTDHISEEDATTLEANVILEIAFDGPPFFAYREKPGPILPQAGRNIVTGRMHR